MITGHATVRICVSQCSQAVECTLYSSGNAGVPAGLRHCPVCIQLQHILHVVMDQCIQIVEGGQLIRILERDLDDIVAVSAARFNRSHRKCGTIHAIACPVKT